MVAYVEHRKENRKTFGTPSGSGAPRDAADHGGLTGKQLFSTPPELASESFEIPASKSSRGLKLE